jgi:trigger factor
MDEWVNQTVNFHIAVTGVSEVSVPDFDDAFVSEYTDYETTEEYEAYIREMLESDNEDTSYYETVTSLFETAVSMSDFSDDYPEELYTSCREEVLSFYSMFTGSDDEEDIYDLFGISSEDIDDEALDTVKQRLLISAIAQEQSIEVTEDEYVEFVTTYAGYYGYSSAVEFEEDNTRDALVWAMYETKVGDYLYDNATIVEETYSGDESGLEEIEFDTEEDVEEDITDVETEAISEAE